MRTCWLRLVFALLGVMTLPACSVGPDYSSPDTSTITDPPFALDADDEHARDDDLAWWSRFDDPQLDQLIERLAGSNLDLKIAEARLREARARRGEAQSGLLPTLDATAGYERLGSGDNALTLGGARPGQETDLFSAGALVGWELDLWGRVHRLVEEANAQVDAAGYEVQATFVSLSGELALNYFDLLALRRRLVLAQQQVELQERTVALAKSRLDAGAGTEIDVAQARSTLEQLRARIPELQQAITQTSSAIGVLLGERQSNETITGDTLPEAPEIIGVGQPSELLMRRADVRSAERQFASSVAAIGAAEGNRYPRITLNGSFVLQSDNLGGMFDDTLVYSFGPALSWPLLNGGRIDAQVETAKAQSEQARYTFERTLLAAISEVESSGRGLVHARQRVQQLKAARDTAQHTVDLANTRYTAGVGGMLDLIDAQRTRADIDDSLVLARQALLAESVRLYRALGGSWLNADAGISDDSENTTQEENAS